MLIAAGSGITPVLSIAASALRHPDAQATVLYGNRRADSVMFADEIADLKDTYPVRLQLAHVLSREPQEVELFSGRLDAARLRRLLPALCAVESIDHWWLCGPYGMVTDAMDVLSELGVPADRVHRELFYVEEAPPDQERHEEPPLTGGCEVTVILDGRTSTTTIEPGTPVLDGAQRVRPDLPFACKGGVCGTCRALRPLRRSADAPQLRAGARRARGRLRAHLPVAAGHRPGHRRLRRLTGGSRGGGRAAARAGGAVRCCSDHPSLVRDRLRGAARTGHRPARRRPRRPRAGPSACSPRRRRSGSSTGRRWPRRTGYPVRSEYKDPGEPDVLPPPDAIIVAPATVNSVNKWAAGICDTLALGILVEGIGLKLPIVAVPWTNAAHAAHPAFAENIGKLRSWGVRVLYGPEVAQPREPGGDDRLTSHGCARSQRPGCPRADGRSANSSQVGCWAP